VTVRLREYPGSKLGVLLILSTANSAAGTTLLDSNLSPSQLEFTNNNHSGVAALTVAIQHSNTNPTIY